MPVLSSFIYFLYFQIYFHVCLPITHPPFHSSAQLFHYPPIVITIITFLVYIIPKSYQKKNFFCSFFPHFLLGLCLVGMMWHKCARARSLTSLAKKKKIGRVISSKPRSMYYVGSYRIRYVHFRPFGHFGASRYRPLITVFGNLIFRSMLLDALGFTNLGLGPALNPKYWLNLRSALTRFSWRVVAS